MVDRVRPQRYTMINLITSTFPLWAVCIQSLYCLSKRLKESYFLVNSYSPSFSPRGLITCGRCPCCLSRTSPITSVSPRLWVNQELVDAAAWFFWWVNFNPACFSSTERSELCHRRRNLVVLRLPLSHSKQLHVTGKMMLHHMGSSCASSLNDFHTKQTMYHCPTAPYVSALRHLFCCDHWNLKHCLSFLFVFCWSLKMFSITVIDNCVVNCDCVSNIHGFIAHQMTDYYVFMLNLSHNYFNCLIKFLSGGQAKILYALNLCMHWYLCELKAKTCFTISIHWREDHCLSEWLQLALEKYLSSAHWQILGLHSGASCLRLLQSNRLLTNHSTSLQCLSCDTGLLQSVTLNVWGFGWCHAGILAP